MSDDAPDDTETDDSLTMRERGNREAKRIAEEKQRRRRESQEFDPLSDRPNNSRRVKIKRTYDALLEVGSDDAQDAAERLRETWPVSKQDRLTRELCAEHLGVKSPLYL